MKTDLIKKLLETFKLGLPKANTFHEFSEGEFGILNTLLVNEKKGHSQMTPKELCEAQSLTSGRISSTLKTLEAKHFITRKTDNFDKRKTLVSLTLKGKELALKMFNRIVDELKDIIDKLGEANTLELIRLLKIINE